MAGRERVLIPGGLGFAGLQLARWLPGSYDILVADVRLPDEREWRFLDRPEGGIRFTRIDVNDGAALEELFRRETPDHVVHCAALTDGGTGGQKDRARMLRLNAGGVLNGIQGALAAGSVRSFLVLSSSGVYRGMGAGEELLRETDPVDPPGTYGLSKLLVERIAGELHRGEGMNVAALRLGSLFGPLEKSGPCRSRISQAGLMAKALAQGRTLCLFGREIRREWLYGRDFARTVGALLERGDWKYPLYNLGGTEAVSLGQMAGAFQGEGMALEWVSAPDGADITMDESSARPLMDLGRLGEEGISLSFTPLDEAVREIVRLNGEC